MTAPARTIEINKTDKTNKQFERLIALMFFPQDIFPNF
jgi:hypothetical protein